VDKQSFLRYLSNDDVHDASVRAVTRNDNELRVVLQTADGRLLAFEFNDVQSLKMHRPEGMVLYSLSEMEASPPYRKFVFTNWDEEDDACLEILAREIKGPESLSDMSFA
jgi:hypothetical protein